MKYDVAGKILIQKCRDELLRRFLGIEAVESELLEEMPQENAGIRRSDYLVRVEDARGDRFLVLFELQSRWEANVPVRLLEYRCGHSLKHGLEVISCVLLLKPSGQALSRFQDREVDYNFNLIKIYEMEASEIIDGDIGCLLPLVPLMKGGVELLDKAESRIYERQLPMIEKADMLSVMAIFSGLVSETLPRELIARRRDIMIESAAYGIIKQEGIVEGYNRGLEEGLHKGLEEGLHKGLEEGLHKGLHKGLEEGLHKGLEEGLHRGMEEGIAKARELVLESLEVRFDLVPLSIRALISQVGDHDLLKTLLRKGITLDSLDDFKAFLEKAIKMQ